MNHFLRRPVSAILVSSLLLLSGCTDTSAASEDSKISDVGFYFDTVTEITLYGTDDTDVLEGCFALMADYEAMLSRTVEGSDVWNINHSNGEPVEVSGETASLIETALTYCDLSGGRFDIAVAPIVDLWNFHEDGDHTLPDDDVLAEALTHIDYHNVTVDGTTVTLQDPDAGIDLGGIAKGYIADRLKDYIVSQGVTSGLINLGGNTLTIGQKPGGKDWKLGIRKPFGETASDLIAILSVNDDSLVTSGNYERYFEKDGIIYHHILDPDTGYPAQTGLQSVSILSDSSADGDALSTTCFLLGAEDGLALIESLDGIEALFVTDEQEIIRSSGFPADES